MQIATKIISYIDGEDKYLATVFHLFFGNLVHQLIDLIQQEQPPLGVLRPGDPGVDAAGNLVYIVPNVVDLRPKLLDLLGGAGPDGHSLDETDQVGPPGETALPGLGHQPLILRWCQLNVKVVFFDFVSPSLSGHLYGFHLKSFLLCGNRRWPEQLWRRFP